jgi:hypothetical protein
MLQIFILSRRQHQIFFRLELICFVNSLSGAYNRSAGTVTGFDLLANLAPSLKCIITVLTNTIP